MTQTQKILTTILVVQLIVAAIVFWPRPAANAGAGPLLPADWEMDALTRLTITDNTGRAVALARVGETWVLDNGSNYPALAENITALLDKIAAISTNRLVARTPAGQTQLEVAETNFARRLDLETTAGDSLTLYIGTAPTFSDVHVRLAGQDEVYLTNALSQSDAPAQIDSWVDANYISLDRTHALQLALRNSHGTFTFEKDAQGAWTLVGLEADQSLNTTRFNLLLTRATSLRLLEPLGDAPQREYGLDAPQASLTVVVTETGQTEPQSYTLTVGAPVPHPDASDAPPSAFFAKWSGSPTYVQIAASLANELLTTTQADLITQPTPTPTATPGADASGAEPTPTPQP